MPFYDAWIDGQFSYRLVQNIFAPGYMRLLREPLEQVFADSKGWVLDVGCGPRPITPEPRGVMVGVDLNPAYLKTYTGGVLDHDASCIGRPPPPGRRMGFQTTAEKLPFRNNVFEEVRTTYFFHHLDDPAACRTLLEMKRCLMPGGRLAIMDMVWPSNPWTRPLAWLTLRLDRGCHVRTEASMRRLLRDVLPGEWTFRRITHTYIGTESLIALSRKAASRKAVRKRR
jgi:SAM-dependent methyltransferase